ncbi:MAG: hypothetical protein ACJ74W_18120 [Pyrinomonadaceae bacterium]
MELAGKRVLVTGANRGLGRALALACEARAVLAGLKPDPLAMEQACAQHRA